MAAERGSRWCAVALRAVLTCAPAAVAAQPPAPLATLSLEELGELEITSVSRRAERLADAPASVFVITADDIRRSGAASLAEALRLAPNLQVARISADAHAISSRGFNSNAANKLLVLVDGRSVYTPLFGGVFWDVQQLPLQDVERIEVVSGPGGTLWGVNAVNGVINVITRSATQTIGTLALAAVGNLDRRAVVRQGWALGRDGGEDAGLRLWARHVDLSATHSAQGQSLGDDGRSTQAGVRGDWQRGADQAMVQAQLYSGQRGAPLPGTVLIPGVPIRVGATETSGGHLLGRWEHALGEAAGALSLQALFDQTERRIEGAFSDRQQLLELQLQHALAPLGRHAPVWGATLRWGHDHFTGSPVATILPAAVSQRWSSLYAQDEIALRQGLRLTLGARLEHNDYTGREFLPNARLAWQVSPQQLLWAAASRTVRAPTRLDRDLHVPGTAPYLLAGAPGMQAEVARVLELGWRGRLGARANASASVYSADYERLRTLERAPGGLLAVGNGMTGRVRGLEAWGSWQAQPAWRLHAGLSRLWQDLRLVADSTDTAAPAATEGANPAWQAQLRSQWDLPHGTELDLALRHVAALSSPAVPAYTALDLRLGWRPRPDLALSLAASNLLDQRHGEFGDVATRSQVGRRVVLQLVLRR